MNRIAEHCKHVETENCKLNRIRQLRSATFGEKSAVDLSVRDAMTILTSISEPTGLMLIGTALILAALSVRRLRVAFRNPA